MIKRVAGACLLALSVAACATAVPPEGGAASGPEDRRLLVLLRWTQQPGAASNASDADSETARAERRRAARQLASSHDLDIESDWVMRSLRLDCFLVRIRDGRPPSGVIEALRRDDRVAWAQPVHRFRALGHADPLFALQPAAVEWHLAELHTRATGRGISIAQIDSGVEVTHPDLDGQIALAKNFVDDSAYAAESHGTAVAGIIVARADNGIGIVGVASGARLMALRACEQASPAATATCDSFSLAKALQFALNQHVDVLNLSLTGPEDELLRRLLDAALEQGVTVVAAADPETDDGGFPASCRAVIAVGSEGGSLRFAGIVAPGEQVPTTLPGARWGLASGSSIAAAHVSGLVALMRELAPSLKPEQARATIWVASGARATASERHVRIDACAALAHASGRCVCSCSADGTGGAALRR